MHEVHPEISFIEEQLGGKIRPTKAFEGADFSGAYIDPKNGFDSDQAAAMLDMEEEALLEYLDGIGKNDLRKEYNALYSQKAIKKREELEMWRFRQGEIKELENALFYGNEKATAKLLKDYPELSSFVEQLLAKGHKDFNLDSALDRAIANLAARETTKTVSQRLEDYQLMRELVTNKKLQDDSIDQQKFMKELILKHGKKVATR